jgi:ferritin-like metal-binding protein YciE
MGVMKLNSLHDLLIAEINDLLSAEKQLLHIFPKVILSARHGELREALETHHRETVLQESRLEECLRELGLAIRPVRSHGMVGIVSSWMELQDAEAQADVRDAATISVLQRATHYEIAGYGCAHAFALSLDKQRVAALLKQTLLEEEEFDRTLTKVAETVVNREAELHPS